MPTLSDRSRTHATEARERLRQSFFTGLTITVPLLITLLVVSIVYGFVFGKLDPLVNIIEKSTGTTLPGFVLQVGAATLVVFLIWLVGFIAESREGDSGLEERFDRAIGSVPGVGGVYRTVNEMSEMVLDADTDSFEEVKLVPFPTPHSYALGFVTAETPESIEEPTGNEEMLTLYVPMSPNPVMGGYVLHVSKDRCVDVDMSVEEGIKSIMTSGVATGEELTEDSESTPTPSTADRTAGNLDSTTTTDTNGDRA